MAAGPGVPAVSTSIEVSSVVVDVRVVDDDGKFVSGLDASAFRAFEDGKQRPIESVVEVRHATTAAQATAERATAAMDGVRPVAERPPRSFVFDPPPSSTDHHHV